MHRKPFKYKISEKIYMAQKKRKKFLKKLERKIVKQVEEPSSEAEFEEMARKLKEGPEADEGMGIENEEERGQEPYPEIEEAERDEDEE